MGGLVHWKQSENAAKIKKSADEPSEWDSCTYL